MRIYVPLTVERLREACRSEQVSAVDGLVFAVTPGLRAEYPGAADEDLEYLAMIDASRASLRLLAAGSEQHWLRVVAAADVPAAKQRPDRDRSAAEMPGSLPWSSVISLHLDSAADAPVVRRAADAVDAADLSDPDAELALGDADDIDLGWYTPTEVRFVLDELTD